MWTTFWDMHSGGSQKEDYALIFIEAPRDEAEIIFQNRFGHNPHRVTCTCCGSDYSIDEADTLEEATAYHRHCEYEDEGYVESQDKSLADIRAKYNTTDNWGLYQTLDELLKTNQLNDHRDRKACFIYDKDIKPEERVGELREEGYVWV